MLRNWVSKNIAAAIVMAYGSQRFTSMRVRSLMLS